MSSKCKFKSDITFIQWTISNKEAVSEWLISHEVGHRHGVEADYRDCVIYSGNKPIRVKDPDLFFIIHVKERRIVVKPYHFIVLLPNNELYIYDEQTFKEFFEVIE